MNIKWKKKAQLFLRLDSKEISPKIPHKGESMQLASAMIPRPFLQVGEKAYLQESLWLYVLLLFVIQIRVNFLSYIDYLIGYGDIRNTKNCKS